MKKGIKTLIAGVMLSGSVIIFSAWTTASEAGDQNAKWVAPASANKLVNPLKGNEEATKEGKKLFKQMCVICHGEKGKGDGIAGMALKPKPSNFTTAAVQSQTDGALFWKMTEGRSPMASYKETLKENQRWQLVNYIRTLKK